MIQAFAIIAIYFHPLTCVQNYIESDCPSYEFVFSLRLLFLRDTVCFKISIDLINVESTSIDDETSKVKMSKCDNVENNLPNNKYAE
jgi:uncharacterized protein YlaN (UPF0358 family)